MSSFSTEQIKKAVNLYFKYNSKIEKVRCELGYPERHTLKKWVDYYKTTGKYFQSKQRETSPYSKTQKKIAVDFYIKNGKCMKETIKTLGYPRKIQTLHDWIKELAPSELRIVKVSENVLKYPKFIIPSGKIYLSPIIDCFDGNEECKIKKIYVKISLLSLVLFILTS